MQILSKMGSRFGYLGGTYPPKTYPSTPFPPPPGGTGVVVHTIYAFRILHIVVPDIVAQILISYGNKKEILIYE